MGLEPMTSSLPRKCSTTELHRHDELLIGTARPWRCQDFPVFLIVLLKNFTDPVGSGLYLSGKRDSNPRPSAWKADALPTELLPPNEIQNVVGRAGFEPTKAIANRFTVCPR